MIVNEYEIELKCVNKNTKTVASVTRTEWAYGLMDAMAQAVMNHSAEIGVGSADITVTHVGPPSRLVEHAISEIKGQVARRLEELGLGVQ